MVRFIALLLMFCTAGVIVADAQCRVACTVSRCNAPQTGTSCHHHRQPSSQQCLHRDNLTRTWIRTALWTGTQLQATGFAAPEFPIPVLDRTSRTAMLDVGGEQPSGPPPQTALRI